MPDFQQLGKREAGLILLEGPDLAWIDKKLFGKACDISAFALVILAIFAGRKSNPMRYIEYIYLAVAVGLVAFFAGNFNDLTTANIIALIAGIIISSFMFSFRRQQRLVIEREERRRLEEMQRQAEDNGDSTS